MWLIIVIWFVWRFLKFKILNFVDGCVKGIIILDIENFNNYEVFK